MLKGFRVVIDKTKDSLRSEWTSAGTHVAVAGAALVALLSLFHRVPVWTACLRGLGAFVAAVAIVRGCAWALSAARRPALRSAKAAAKPAKS